MYAETVDLSCSNKPGRRFTTAAPSVQRPRGLDRRELNFKLSAQPEIPTWRLFGTGVRWK